MYNSTIIVKKKRLKCGCYDFAFSKGRCRTHATQEDSLKRISEHEMDEDAESWQNLRDDLDAAFSLYIRTSHADENGIVACYTSGVKLPIGQIQNGHFISRSNLATRWYEPNCRPQSQHDNEFLHGNLEVFRQKLEKEQAGLPDELLQLSREVTKPTISQLKELLILYRNKLKFAQLKLKK